MANGVTIHLMRHEKTQANVERRYIGRKDESILQAATREMTHQTEVVYTSAKKRSIQTAELYFPFAQIVQHVGFNELDFGQFEMKTYEDLKDDELYRAWIDAPHEVTPPEGERFLDFQQRILRAFADIVVKEGTYTFVVHGGVIRVLLAAFLPTKQSFQQVQAAHHTQYTLTWENIEAVKEGARCTSYSEAYLTEKQHT